MDDLEKFCATLRQAGVSCEVWVNGSFMTHKADPKDVDLVIRVEWAEIENNPANEATIQWAKQDHSGHLGCDSYVLIEYPETHPEYASSLALRSYWRGQFGFNRANEVKGIAVVKV